MIPALALQHYDESLTLSDAQRLRIAADYGRTLLKQATDYLVSEGVWLPDTTAELVLDQHMTAQASEVVSP